MYNTFTISIIPCTVSIAVLLFMILSVPNALHSISVLLYNNDTVTDRFLLVTILPKSSAPSWLNPFIITDSCVADEPLTLYPTSSVLSAVQVNSTVVPSTTLIDSGWTRNTIIRRTIITIIIMFSSKLVQYDHYSLKW